MDLRRSKLNPIQLIFLAVLLLGGCAGGDTADELWSVTVELAVQDVSPGHIEARVTWLGETVSEPLNDIAAGGDRINGDDVYSAHFHGPPTRFVAVTFARNEDGKMIEGYRSIERVPWGGGTLAYGLANHKNLTVQRLSSAGTEKAVETGEVTRTAGGVLWSWFCLLVALVLIGKWNRGATPHRYHWPRWGTPAVFFTLSTLWTWPALLAGGSRGVGLHFDAYGTIWSISAASRLLPSLTDTFTAWPLGASHQAFDSFTLLPMAAALDWLGPVRLHAYLGLIGVAVSAWAAERFAHKLGALRPWSLIAGITFAFSGLGATALLEGHVYHVLNPWLPLFGLHWWQSCGPDGTQKDSILAGLFFVLTLYTTAYLGVAATIIAIGFFVGAAIRREVCLRRSLTTLVIVAPALVPLIWGITNQGGGAESIHRIVLGSTHLSNIGIPTPEIDRAGHSVAVGLGGVAFALTLLSPLVLPKGRLRVLFWTACGALLLSFGPVFSLSPDNTLLPLPTYPFWDLSWMKQIRFPIRLLWAWFLCSGVLASLVATRLSSSPHARIIPALIVTHAFLFVALPFRQSFVLTASPSTYGSIENGAVLELMGSGTDPSGEYDNWTSAASCVRQATHKRAIAEDCVRLPVQANPRMKLQKWVEDRLRDGDAEIAQNRLAQMGFAAVAWHPDLYSPGDRARLQHTLSLWRKPSKTTDGGDHVWTYTLEPDESVTSAIPGDSPSVSHGTGADGRAGDVFIELHIPFDPAHGQINESLQVGGWSEAAYRLAYTISGDSYSVSLSNDGSEPGDWQDDYIWTAHMPGPLPSRLKVSLLASRLSQPESVLWSGPVSIYGKNDRIAFLYTNEGVRPTNASADRPNPPARRGVGTVSAMGWSGWIAIILLWMLKRRREGAVG